jgi:hypothetical protein
MKDVAALDSPVVSNFWRNLEPNERLKRVIEVRDSNTRFSPIQTSRVFPNGEIFVNLVEAIPASIRGSLLLDFEAELKSKIDNGIVVWCEPIGDKSTLRNLRGIQIKVEPASVPR